MSPAQTPAGGAGRRPGVGRRSGGRGAAAGETCRTSETSSRLPIEVPVSVSVKVPCQVRSGRARLGHGVCVQSRGCVCKFGCVRSHGRTRSLSPRGRRVSAAPVLPRPPAGPRSVLGVPQGGAQATNVGSLLLPAASAPASPSSCLAPRPPGPRGCGRPAVWTGLAPASLAVGPPEGCVCPRASCAVGTVRLSPAPLWSGGRAPSPRGQGGECFWGGGAG